MVSGQEFGKHLTQRSLSHSAKVGCSFIYLILKIYFIIFIYSLCVCICVGVCVHVHLCSAACTGQKVLDSLDLELWVTELFNLGARNSWPF